MYCKKHFYESMYNQKEVQTENYQWFFKFLGPKFFCYLDTGFENNLKNIVKIGF